MDQKIVAAPAATRARGRWWFALGITVPFLAILIYAVQFHFKILTMPWYVPILGLLGLVAMSIALWQRPTVIRVIGLCFIALLCVGEVLFLSSVSKLPAYSGPVRVGEPVPKFKTKLAGGSLFADQDLKQGKSTALIFFRGRW